MQILYICGYSSPSEHAARFGTVGYGCGGNAKIECVVQALMMAGHGVTILSSLASASSSWRILRWHEEVTTHTEWPVRVIYPDLFCATSVGGAVRLLSAGRSALSVAREVQPDVVIAYNANAFEAIAARAVARTYGVPLVLEVEDLPKTRRRGLFNAKPVLDKMFWDSTVSLARAFTAVNDSILEALPSSCPRVLLPGAIDERLLRAQAHRTRAFSGAARVMGYFGGLSRDKGCDVLVQVAPQLPSPWKLIVSGSGPLSVEFERLACAYPEKVCFLGSISRKEVYSAMCGADVTVIPRERLNDSGAGVFPFKLCEYVVAGTHVISAHEATLRTVDLSFLKRWDGSAGALLSCLQLAERTYAVERERYDRAIVTIKTEYSIGAIGVKLDTLARSVVML